VVRNTIYFSGNAIGKSLIVLACYLVAGAATVIAIRHRQSTSAEEAELEASAAVGAIV
jgi:hypothetical protein